MGFFDMFKKNPDRGGNSVNQSKENNTVEYNRNVRAIPARYVLKCDYPGLEFITFIHSARFGYSYIDQYSSFMRCLEDVVSRVLEEQVRKAISVLYFTEEHAQPAGHFDYYDVEKTVNGYVPYNENVEASLIAIDKDEKIIETKIIKIMDYLDNDPDYFREYGVSDAVYQYISTALKRFEKEACWHFALETENAFYENVSFWPSPQKDGSWIDDDGTVLQPYMWFGVKGRKPEELWSLHGDMSEEDLEFWFSEAPLDYIIENDEGIYSFFGGSTAKEDIDEPDMETIIESCPILIDEDDTPESIEEKLQAFFIEQYQKAGI